MNETTVQESLFEDPIGLRFRHARERQRLSQEVVAQQLKLPVAIIDAVEREDWIRLGAPVYVRSYVGSYARLLDLPVTLVDEIVANKPVPPLVVVADGSGARRMFDRGLLKLAYVVITVALLGTAGMLAMHFQAPARVAQLLPLDPPVAAARGPSRAAAPSPAAVTGANSRVPAIPAAESAPAAAMMASLAPSLPPSSDAETLVFHFSAPSWFEATNAAGQRIERGLVPAGSERRYQPGQVSRITFGNASAVLVSQGGHALDLTPYREADIVRFAVSSQGRLSPTGD